MAMKNLTPLFLRTAKPGTYWDTQTQGLHIRVGKNRKTWQMRFLQGDKYQFERLGYFPEVDVKEARDQAAGIAARIEQGVPVVVLAPVHAKARPTIGDMLDRYEAWRLRQNDKRNKSVPEAMRALRYAFTQLGFIGTIAEDFTKADLRLMRDQIAAGATQKKAKRGQPAPYASNRFMAYLGPVTRWASSEEIIQHNLVLDIMRHGGEKKRDRVLSNEEIIAIWNACAKMDAGVAKSYAKMIRFLLVTAQRKDEAGSILIGDIENGAWAFEKNKANRPQSLKLPRLALEQIPHGEADHLAFGGRTGNKISGFSKLKTLLQELSGTSDWRLHDLRRTAATGMQGLVIQEVIEGVLNHAIPGVGGVYMRSLMIEDKERALRLWAEKLEGILGINRPVLKVVS